MRSVRRWPSRHLNTGDTAPEGGRQTERGHDRGKRRELSRPKTVAGDERERWVRCDGGSEADICVGRVIEERECSGRRWKLSKRERGTFSAGVMGDREREGVGGELICVTQGPGLKN